MIMDNRPLAVDADGCVWRINDGGSLSMARTNPDNSPTPEPLTVYVPALPAAQLDETVQALYARLSETRGYLRGYEGTALLPHHDDCCPKHQQWLAARRTERDSLREREANILTALGRLHALASEVSR